MLKAFTLADSSDYDVETIQSGVALPDGTQFDVGEALRTGNGTIVTDDRNLQATLDGFHLVEECEVPADELPDYGSNTKDDLRAEVEARGLDVSDDATKADLVAALEQNDSEGS